MTNNALKHIKEVYLTDSSMPMRDVISALIERMEAAEDVIEHTWSGCTHDYICNCPNFNPIPQDKYEYWQKIKRGK